MAKDYVMQLSTPSFWLSLAVASAVSLSTAFVTAETYRGKVNLRGVIVQRGETSEMIVKLSGPNLVASNGRIARMNAGGFYSINGTKSTGKYKGYLKRITNEYGDVVRKRQKNRIRVSSRTIRFKDGKIRLKKRLRVQEFGRTRIRGEGKFVIRL